MIERYEEDWDDGSVETIDITVSGDEAVVTLTVTRDGDAGFSIEKIRELGEVYLTDAGMVLAADAVRVLRARDRDVHVPGFEVDMTGDADASAEDTEADGEIEPVMSVEEYLREHRWVTVNEMADEIGYTKRQVRNRIQALDDVLRKPDPDDGRRKLYTIDDGDVDASEAEGSDDADGSSDSTTENGERWCGLCGFGPHSQTKILSHHGDVHGDPDPDVRDTEPETVVADEGVWCGRCGDGPFESEADLEEHHEIAHHEDEEVITHEDGPEGDSSGEYGFRDWDGN